MANEIPVSWGIRDDDVVVFVDPDDSSGLAETLEHAVGPAAVAVLQMLHDLQIEVHVHLKSDMCIVMKSKGLLRNSQVC